MAEQPTVQPSLERVQQSIVDLLDKRPASSSICPSEVARSLATRNWRVLMPLVRDAARALARGGVIEITQRGKVVAPEGEFRGPIRLRKVR